MKSMFFILMVLLFFVCPVFAQGDAYGDSNWGVPLESQGGPPAGEAEEETFDNEQAQTIYEKYGSNTSPSFLNDQGTDLYDQDHGGDSFDTSK